MKMASQLDSAWGDVNVIYHYEDDPRETPCNFPEKCLNDETGLYYYGHRFYNPQIGGWASMDPIQELGGLNLYGFVGNNAFDHFDELGFACSWAVGKCPRNLASVSVPSIVTIGVNDYYIPQWVRNLIDAIIPDHVDVKIESYKMPNCVIGSVVEETIVRGFFADSTLAALGNYAVSLAFPSSGVSGAVGGHVENSLGTEGPCTLSCVSKAYYDTVKARIEPLPQLHSYKILYPNKYNCWDWAAEALAP